jgi:hypothetical protein
VIAVARSSASFGKLANYLVKERDGIERVDWVASRNLPTSDPRFAAEFMRATAAANPRVAEPVYHLAVSFHPGDVVTRETMERVADRLLADLKLQGHQVVIVAHKDRPHAHFHLMVNRVHPETGRAWNRWQDQVVTQRVLREEERALGLREVRGRLYQLPDQEAPGRAVRTSGEHRQAARSGADPLVDRVRAHVDELRAARSWGELHAQVAARDLHLERKGQGLVITDGENQVKASRVHRDLSFKSLEARLGAYQDRELRPDIAPANPRPVDVPSPATAHVRGGDAGVRAVAPDPVAARVADLVRTAERVGRVGRVSFTADSIRSGYASGVRGLEWAKARVEGVDRTFERELTRVYADPADARLRFHAAARATGAGAAAERMREQPETFGALRLGERTRAWGLITVTDTQEARRHVVVASVVGRQAGDAAAMLRDYVNARLPRGATQEAHRADAYASALTHTTHRLQVAERRVAHLRALQATLPDRRTLDKAIGGLAMGLLPKQVSQVAFLLTDPQRAILYAAISLARELARGVGLSR